MKTILITGAASGIGKATAILFSENGWNVVAAMRNIEKCPELSERRNIKALYLDVKDRKSIDYCIEQTISDFGKIDAVVNNAGIYITDPLELSSDEDIENLVRTNIIGTISVTKAILKHFRENKAGVIVNVSSIAGRVTFPFQSVYHTSKWAIEGMSESLLYELKPLNIKVKIIEPGMVKTHLYQSVLNKLADEYPISYKSNFKQWHSYLMHNFKNGYSPILDAKTIYKAVNDNSFKLRYRSDFTTRMVLSIRSFLGLTLFQSIIKKQSNLR